MKECVNCNMVYLEKAWSLDVLYEQFAWEKSTVAEDIRRDEIRGIERNFSKITRKRLAILPRKNAANWLTRHAKPGNILDVGSGDGQYLLQLPEQYMPYGVEISSHAVNAGKPEIQARGGDLINKDALTGLQGFEPNFFNGIIMRSFLEHDIRPKEILQEACRVLTKEGFLLIKVPNYDSLNRKIRGAKWCGFRFPEHVNYFTPQTLTRLLINSGFSIYRFGFFDRLPTSDNMWVMAKK